MDNLEFKNRNEIDDEEGEEKIERITIHMQLFNNIAKFSETYLVECQVQQMVSKEVCRKAKNLLKELLEFTDWNS